MKLRIYNKKNKPLHSLALTITKMVSRKGFTIAQDGNNEFTVQHLTDKVQQDFIKTLVIKWCDKNGVRYECITK